MASLRMRVAFKIIFLGFALGVSFYHIAVMGYSYRDRFTDFVDELKTPKKMSWKIELLTFVMNLQSHERKVFSQNNEDGILLAIFNRIGVKYKTYVEFGVQDGKECNTRFLREELGWKGLMMDGGFENLKINLRREMIFPNNIVQLFRKYNVSKQIDLLSVDTDYKDFWLIQKILAAGYRPRVIIHEYNSYIGPFEAKTVPINWWETRFNYTKHYSFSVTAGWHLGRYYGYSMVYCETKGVNCVWVIDGEQGFGTGIRISDYLNASSLWRQARHFPNTCKEYRPVPPNRNWTWISASTTFL